jgi:catechol 2,3-dioxygenase-like lactoylglutathione lyase family enzyme
MPERSRSTNPAYDREEDAAMTSRFSELAVDARDTRAAANFWCQVLGYRVIDEEDDYVEIASWEPDRDALRRGPAPPTIVFAPVPEGKTLKNRIHIDVSPVDRSQEDEVRRLEDLGARRIDIGQGDVGWVVMADPEGNEFCVLRSLVQAPQDQAS